MGRRLHIQIGLGLSALAIILSGCGLGFEGRFAGSLVWLPWSEQGGNIKFTKVHLKTLSDPRRISGAAARVYWQAGAGGEKGFSGPVVEPRLARRGHTWLPLDIVSQQGLAVYGIYERLMEFDKSLGVQGRLQWPRSVGLQIRVRTPTGPKFNNALYDPDLDATIVVPYLLDDMPPALNKGILAHEHFHAHFASVFHNVVQTKNRMAPTQTELMNTLSVAGWNEGLADFYAYVFTQDPSFMKASFSGAIGLRELKGAPPSLPTWVSLANEVSCAKYPCHFPALDLPVIYYMGTSLARTLVLWSETVKTPNASMLILKDVFSLLEHWPTDFEATVKSGQVEPSGFLQALIQHSKLPIPPALCEELKKTVYPSHPQFVARGCQP